MNKIFHHGGLLISTLSVLALLAACSGGAGAPPTEAPTTAPAAPTAPASGGAATSAPAAPTAAAAPPQPTSAPGATTAPATQPSAGPAGGGTTAYLDDRSTPEGVILSFYNAINRREYVRAYSYWEPEAAAQNLPPFAEWQGGYADTGTVQVTVWRAASDAGAGQINYGVPVIVTSQQRDGSSLAFGGCYRLHLANPGIQSEPPFRPRGIRSADLRQVSTPEEAEAAAAEACGTALQPSTALVPPDNLPIDAGQYLDDRSSGIGLVRSFYNAINRREYARAYSYWEPETAAQNLPPFAEWQGGYTGTGTVELTTGTEQTGVGAGQIYASVPVTVRAQQADGSSQIFVGCYQLHLANPSIQSEPPFRPLGIRSADVRPVAALADTNALMQSACPTQ
ncbi:MAG TPA: hypothetical protein VFS21_12860 [Roseiflexaceae bacterium]|nr:hypothetical protein [Roseiflexaceae bacterium]